MRVHYLQHVPFEGLGFIRSWLDDHGCDVTSTSLYADEVLPDSRHLDWLIIMGGPMGVHDTQRYPWLDMELSLIKKCIEDGKTVLGICLGAQLIATALGVEVRRNPVAEIGWFSINRDSSLANHPLADILPDRFTTFHWHGDTFSIPDGAQRLAASDVCLNQGFVYHDRVLALQFHPEMTAASLQDLIRHCADEIVPGASIQTAAEMTACAERYLDNNHKLTSRLLDYLLQQHR